MTRTIRMKDIAGLKANATTAPYATTEPAKIGGVRGGGSTPAPQGVIFQESFDDQPDWHSGLEINDIGDPPGLPDRSQLPSQGHTIPENWYAVRQEPAWAPSTGHPDRHESIEILASNSDKARGGSGKSYVSWRDSADPTHKWWSESVLLKYLPEGYDEIYVEFWISFSPDMVAARRSADSAKIFRIESWSQENSIFQAFGGGEIGPAFIWNWAPGLNYGIRNQFTLRGGPHGENYTMTTAELGDLPRGAMNFTNDTVGMGVNGTTPEIPDKVNGGFIPRDGSNVWHDQIFGVSGTWTKMAFYVKMNSAPGVGDGICRQWLDDLQIHNNTTVSWVNPVNGDSSFVMPKWNLFSIGGNDYFHDYPDEDRHEEWYAIDDLVARDSIPEELL